MRKSIEEIENEARNEIYDLLSKGDQNIRAQIIEIHAGMLIDQEETITLFESGQLTERDVAHRVNESLAASLKKIAAIVGDELVKEVFHVDPNEPVQLVDPDLMVPHG